MLQDKEELLPGQTVVFRLPHEPWMFWPRLRPARFPVLQDWRLQFLGRPAAGRRDVREELGLGQAGQVLDLLLDKEVEWFLG